MTGTGIGDGDLLRVPALTLGLGLLFFWGWPGVIAPSLTLRVVNWIPVLVPVRAARLDDYIFGGTVSRSDAEGESDLVGALGGGDLVNGLPLCWLG